MSSVTKDACKDNAPARRPHRRTAVLAAGLTAALFGAPSSAGANEFQINACGADRSNYSTQAFEDFATRGMLWRRACNPEGPGIRGLVTANVQRAGRVERGSRSIFVLRAPEGTRFSRFTWSGGAARSDCRYALHLWVYRPDGPTTSIKNVQANKKCASRGRIQIATRWSRPRTYDVSGATSIVQRIICMGDNGEPYCASRGKNYISTFTASATVVDVTTPTVGIVQDNPFTRGEWVRGTQSVTYDASDNVGVRAARAVVGGLYGEENARPCDWAQRVPCPNGPGAIRVDTTTVAEGSQALAVEAYDAAQNISPSGPVTVRVDNTAPGAVPVTVDGGDGWRNQNNFSLTWVNPEEADRAPVSAARYRVCQARTSDCSDNSRTGAGIQRLADLTVAGPGEWQARVWREDAAGNQEPANASVPVTLRFDPEPPQLAFEPVQAADPTLIAALVTDKVSGLAGGTIELSREGSGSWQALATQQQGSRLVARVDDAALPTGTYLLRATARDQALNQNSTDRRQDGSPMVVNLPLRGRSVMRAGVVTKRIVRRKVGRQEKRRTVRRRVTTRSRRARVEYGDRVAIGGRLENGDGQSIVGAEVQVLSRTAAAAEEQLGVVRTDNRGRFRYGASANASRTLRFVYAGTSQMLPAQGEVSLSVMADSTIRARPRRLLNGRAVKFSGRLQSLPAPPVGKLIELQVVLSGRWQTFRTTRTDGRGNWQVRYRFRRTCGLTKYRFRAQLPAEAAYPFESGRTRTVKVRVRGEPCQ